MIRNSAIAYVAFFVGLFVAFGAGAQDRFDGQYAGSSITTSTGCAGRALRMTVKGDEVIWRASHESVGTIDNDGTVAVNSISPGGLLSTTAGTIADGVFFGTTSSSRCVWHDRLARAAKPDSHPS